MGDSCLYCLVLRPIKEKKVKLNDDCSRNSKKPLCGTNWNYGFEMGQTTDMSYRGHQYSWLRCSFNKSHTSAVQLSWMWSLPMQQVTLSTPVGSDMHRDSSTCTALTGFSPRTTSPYSGSPARLNPVGFLVLLIYTKACRLSPQSEDCNCIFRLIRQ